MLRLPGASEWSGSEYTRLHLAAGKPNYVHVLYEFSGMKLSNGIDYKTGFYSIPIASGKAEWFAGPTDDNDDDQYNARDANGRFIFFEGENPMAGQKMLSANCSYWEYLSNPKSHNSIRTLHQFYRGSVLSPREYIISQMSPDGLFVFVRFQEPCTRKGLSEHGWFNTYYVIDVIKGSSTLVMKDEVEHVTTGSASRIVWTH